MAEQLAGTEHEPGIILSALEAAAEMKAVKLKVLIGRCYEILGQAKTNESPPCMDDDFLQELEAAMK